PAMRLTVTFRTHGAYPRPGQANPTRRWTLECWPPGGSHPARAAACKELAHHAGDLSARRVQCLVIVAGAPSATVSGTVRGRRIAFAASTCAPAWRTLRVLLTGR
ncbi:MAG TPA: SSI family serine proteinase inhibitor, partial [Solirubrobacteraceae bacterium]|nr:SSI family serine proteinase inhibitor [Solirubrobacteraceae bacterium]